VFVLALLMFGACIPAALIVARAPARWQPASAGRYGSGRVRITSNRVSGLYPGARRTLILTLHNSVSRHAVVVRRLRVRDAATSKRGCAPSRRNLRIRYPKIGRLRIRPGRSRRVVALLTMPNTVAKACQRAVFRLRYSVQILARRRAR
jgi:hypothetical protein